MLCYQPCETSKEEIVNEGANSLKAMHLRCIDPTGRATLQEQAKEHAAQKAADPGAAEGGGLGARRKEGGDSRSAAERTAQCEGGKAERTANTEARGRQLQSHYGSAVESFHLH